ncbi:MAG: hypothetical protein JST58_17365 [Bacteroidetes bacterium]|nr:hypothetical protein [Bacteroidota bacterium]
MSKLEHALHNEKVFNHLLPKTEFCDWIITTAFYSALHFIEYKIFPFEHEIAGNKVTFRNVGEYKLITKSPKSAHDLRHDLVIWHCQEIEMAYKFLLDSCWNARYYNYKLSNPAIAIGFAKTYLKSIKEHCIKK